MLTKLRGQTRIKAVSGPMFDCWKRGGGVGGRGWGWGGGASPLAALGGLL